MKEHSRTDDQFTNLHSSDTHARSMVSFCRYCKYIKVRGSVMDEYTSFWCHEYFQTNFELNIVHCRRFITKINYN